jgi:CheY-like chemotaxis protein
LRGGFFLFDVHGGAEGGSTASSNRRVHLAGVNDGKQRRLYLNGKRIGKTDDPGILKPGAEPGKLRIGGILENLGYRVHQTSDGKRALDILHGTEHFDLLLTDMVMPQMSGRYFAEWLRKTSPQTKVVFISGYLEESLHPGDRRDQEMFFLPKPFDPEQLATKIREALDSGKTD